MGVHRGYLLQWAVVSAGKIRTAIPGTVQEAAPGSLHGLLWRAFGVFLIVLALHIPLVDGLSRRDAMFAQAMIFGDAKEVPAVCGLIVLTTSSTVEMWQAKNGTGIVQIIPTGRIARIVLERPPICWHWPVRRQRIDRQSRHNVSMASLQPLDLESSKPGRRKANRETIMRYRLTFYFFLLVSASACIFAQSQAEKRSKSQSWPAALRRGSRKLPASIQVCIEMWPGTVA